MSAHRYGYGALAVLIFALSALFGIGIGTISGTERPMQATIRAGGTATSEEVPDNSLQTTTSMTTTVTTTPTSTTILTPTHTTTPTPTITIPITVPTTTPTPTITIPITVPTTTPTPTITIPITTPITRTRATFVAAGSNYTCVLTNEGGVRCWGNNEEGQLGDGLGGEVGRTSTTPVDVQGLEYSVTALAAGNNYTCALTEAGGVRCWGNNEEGQLGDGLGGESNERLTPVQVRGLESGVTAIAARWSHTCALTEAGDVRCWGNNEEGQLGDGTSGEENTRFTPVQVRGLESGITAITTGNSHTCALTEAGGVLCWGNNEEGQLGDGTRENSPTPVQVRGLERGVTAVSAGSNYTCAVTEAGGVLCWGREWRGLFNGTRGNNRIPMPVRGLESGVVALSAGTDYACALTDAGGMLCWGDNGSGRLGGGSIGADPTLVQVRGLESGVTAIAAMSHHTCALTDAGGVFCWGANWSGELGNGMKRHSPIHEPVQVIGLEHGVTTIAVGSGHTCALTEAGGVRCWGANNTGQLGNGLGGEPSYNSLIPVQVRGLERGVTTIAAGSEHVCALTETDRVLCWGLNQSGQLGDGNEEQDEHPVPIPLQWLERGVSAVAAGGKHTCVLTDKGSVLCWGDNWFGQLGNGTGGQRGDHSPTAVQVSGLDHGVTALAAGWGHTCALTEAGSVLCWGNNSSGQLGDGTSGSYNRSLVPVQVRGLEQGVTAIAAGSVHTCAVTESDDVFCWGDNSSGQLGNGTGGERDDHSSIPVKVRGLEGGVIALAAGSGQTCVITDKGDMLCSGRRRSVQPENADSLGYEENLTPVPVAGLKHGVTAIAHGNVHTCAVTDAGGVLCWGNNSSGELGNGTRESSAVPVEVLLEAPIEQSKQHLPDDPTPMPTVEPGEQDESLLVYLPLIAR